MYNNNYNYNPNWYQPPGPQPGKHEATVAMVLGIVSCALLIFGYTALGSVVTGIIGLIYASRAKSLGFNGTPRTVGYVCSLIGLILGVLVCLAASCGSARGRSACSLRSLEQLPCDILKEKERNRYE